MNIRVADPVEVPSIIGMPLTGFEKPVAEALTQYSERTNGGVSFDIDAAVRLELTPHEPYSARSISAINHLGEQAGKLVIIAFAPGDGTGGSLTDNAKETGRVEWCFGNPIIPKPRPKVVMEACLPIATYEPSTAIRFLMNPDVSWWRSPSMNENYLDLLGLSAKSKSNPWVVNRVHRLAVVGQSGPQTIIRIGEPPTPTITYTTGFTETGDRYGDPSAVCNPTDTLQLCAFIAITSEMDASHSDMLDELGATEPKFMG